MRSSLPLARPLPAVLALLFAAFLPHVRCATNDASSDAERPVEDATKHRLLAKAKANLPTLYIIGDSTVRVGTPQQRGWGDELPAFFNLEKINVVNHAIGGRSSRTFITEGRWAASLAMMQKGDFLLIQFGHNDGGAINDDSRARGSLRGTGEETQEIDNILTKKRETVHTYGWYLRQYLREASDKGVTAIVCSPIPRNFWTSNAAAVQRSGRDSYGGWARETATAAHAPFIDLNEIIATGYEKLGRDAVAEFFTFNPAATRQDGTHTSVKGAQFNARCVVSGLRALPGAPLDGFLSETGRAVSPFTGAP
jgi:lysophospholipase L1-like esterase